MFLEKIPVEEEIIASGKIMDYRLKESKKGESFDRDCIKIYCKERNKNLHVLIDAKNHEIIGEAIKKKKSIEVEGILNQKENGFWYLDNPKNIKIVN